MSENNGYIELPTDADGVPINLGDLMVGDGGRPFKVYSIEFSKDTCRICGNGVYTDPVECRHYSQPTVQELLEEYRIRTYSLSRRFANDSMTVVEYNESIKRLNDELAKVLQIREVE